MTKFEYHPAEYWQIVGPYIGAARGASPEHKEQEEYLIGLLQSIQPIKSVLDVGCGGGRMALLLQEALPKTKYTGIDIGEAQVEATRRLRPDALVFHSSLQDFDPGQDWQLVLASEVLMHIAPDQIQKAVNRIVELSSEWIVTIDWSQPIGTTKAASWNWLHDYRSLFQKAGADVEFERVVHLQSIYLIRVR